MDLFTLFLDLGFRHILEGYDHILFLVGLMIVTEHPKEIMKVITAFTITHSTTLILTALHIVSLPSLWTEALIALSIAYVGIENLIRKNRNGRWMVAAAFGLIHGAGFSGHLTELLQAMLGSGNIWAPLMGFNVGIELGQIVVVSFGLGILWLLRNSPKRQLVVTSVSVFVALSGIGLLVLRLVRSPL